MRPVRSLGTSRARTSGFGALPVDQSAKPKLIAEGCDKKTHEQDIKARRCGCKSYVLEPSLSINLRCSTPETATCKTSDQLCHLRCQPRRSKAHLRQCARGCHSCGTSQRRTAASVGQTCCKASRTSAKQSNVLFTQRSLPKQRFAGLKNGDLHERRQHRVEAVEVLVHKVPELRRELQAATG